MIGDGHGDDTRLFAGRLVVQAAWPALLVLAVLLAAPFAALAGVDPNGPLLGPAAALAALGALATLGLSLLLAFDALLFRLIASHESEVAGGTAVDDILARMRLKPVPEGRRSLAARIAGTRRLLARQRAAFGLFAASVAFIAYLSRASL